MPQYKVVKIKFKIGVDGRYFIINTIPFVVGFPGCSEVINAYAVVLSQRHNNANVVWQELGNEYFHGFIKAGMYEGDEELFDEVAGMEGLE